MSSGSHRVAELFPEQVWLPKLEGSSAKFVEGLARVTHVITADGALPRGLKMLCAGAISAVKRDAGLVDHFLSAAEKSGIPRGHAEGAAIGLMISRGATPYELFLAALEQAYGPAESPSNASATTFGGDVTSAYTYFESYFGFVPDYVRLLGERAAPALEGYFLMREASLGETQLPSRDMELLLCAVNSAEYQPRFVAIHARGARRAGANEDELVEAALTALPFAGVASWLPAAQGIIESRDDG